MSELSFLPNWFSRPGEALCKQMQRVGMDSFVLSQKLDMNISGLIGVLCGVTPIDQSLAQKLSKVFPLSEGFWLRRQSIYDSSLTRLSEEVDTKTASEWTKSIPIAEIAKTFSLSRPSHRSELLRWGLAFYGVANPKQWQERYGKISTDINLRTSNTYSSDFGALTAWLRRAEIEARSMQCSTWNQKLLEQNLDRMRVLTKAKQASYFLPRLRQICAESGVALIVLRAPRGCRASGAATFVSRDRAMILLSFRHMTDDHIWFTFFHEVGHLLLHSNQETFVDHEVASGEEKERQANNFASSTLVPSNKYQEMINLKSHRNSIIRFAVSIGTSPGIVVGQMQNAGLIQRDQMNFLKTKFSINDLYH